MPITDHQQRIAFGPGGQILQVPENEQLLEQLRETPILSPVELSKLSTFFRAYPTNVPLANHLALVGLMALAQREPVEQSLTKTTDQGAQQPFFDFWEDFLDNASDEFTEPVSSVKAVDVKWLPLSGIGLLIESPEILGGARSYYVIGVSPNPASLPPN